MTLIGKKTEKAPFRFDTVGSFLRPQEIKKARKDFVEGNLSANALKEIENKIITDLVKKEKEIGLQVVTDGEFRRAYWHLDAFWGIGGAGHVITPDAGFPFQGVKTHPDTVRLHTKLYEQEHPFLEHFKFLKKIADKEGVVAKQTFPAPARFFTILTSELNEKFTDAVYPNRDELKSDIVKIYKALILDFYNAGCRFIQLDDTTWGNIAGAFIDPKFKKFHFTEKEGSLDDLCKVLLELNNAVLKDLPKDLVVGEHVCKGNFRSTWTTSGSYDPVAPYFFKQNFDIFFCEWDDERSGDLQALKHLSKGNQIVELGFFTTKRPDLEPKELILKRLEEALKYVPDINQLTIGNQCGYASTEEGNSLTEEEQWIKLKYIKDIIDEIWK
jgi:methionine synthase II (cobalamin-independent)